MAKVNLDKLVVLDIETLCNCFMVCCRDYKTGKKKSFIIFDDKQYSKEAFELFKFLRTCVRSGYTLVTFNGIAFDAQVLHYFYDWCSAKVDPLYELDTKLVIDSLYNEAQRIIALPEEEKFKELIYENDLFLPVIDLFKQKHFDRPQKATSLKWVQFTMNYPNIEEMPIGHDVPITKDQIEDVLNYCWNDVDSTYEFFNKIKFETELRLALGEEYNRNLINASEPKMAREIFGKYLCDEMKIQYVELKQMKTFRKKVVFKDIIFPYVKFLTPELKKVHTDFINTVVDCTPGVKDSFEYTFNYGGLDIYLGLGGIHSCVPSGVYAPKEDEIMEDADVTSFYPKLGIENNVKPEHLGDIFSKVYNNIFIERQKYPKSDPKNYIFKILLNSAYGLSSEINSYFYDKKYTYTITINGQLSLLMLVEALYLGVPGVRIIQKNTDGVTYIYNKEYAEKVKKICAWWERTTKLQLEYAHYSKMIIRDVNNYIAIPTEAKKDIKKKGIFETKVDYHKNPSYMIVPKALEAYFVKGMNIIDTIHNHDNIYDFCGAAKRKSNFKLNLYRDLGNSEICNEQQKVTRFIISKPNEDSGLLMKDFNDGRRVSVIANTLVTPLNTIKEGFEAAKRYPINYDWYVKEARKIVELIEPPTVQQTLF